MLPRPKTIQPVHGSQKSRSVHTDNLDHPHNSEDERKVGDERQRGGERFWRGCEKKERTEERK